MLTSKWAPPPGASFARLLSAKDLPAEELAEELGFDDAGFDLLIAGEQRITADIAATLSEHPRALDLFDDAYL